MISFIGGAAASATTITIPAGHQVADMIFMFAFNNASITVPTVPAGWTTFMTPAAANVCAGVLCYKFAASSSETSGTWTGATQLATVVYRGTRGLMNGSNGTNSNSTIAIPALGATTALTSGSTWRISFAAHATATNVNVGPAQHVGRATNIGNIWIGDSNGPADPVTNSGIITYAVNASAGWEGMTIFLQASKMEWNNFEAVRVMNGMSATERIIH